MTNVLPLRRDREPVIGGSDAAAAAGVDPYRSAVTLWVVKTGRDKLGKLSPYTEAMRWGTLFEPVIFDALAEDGYEVERAEGAEFTDPERPWLIGHPDGFVTFEDGTRGVVEVKTTNSFAHRANGAPLALQYACQGLHYMHVTGLDRVLFAVLVNGQRLETYELPRNDHTIELLLAAEERLHWHIVTDTQPPYDGSDSTRDALAVQYPQASDRAVRLDKDGMRDVAELRARKEQRKAIEAQEQAIENRLKARMGDAEVAVSPNDEEVLRWTNVSSTRLDSKRLRAEVPAIAEQYDTTTQTRRFTLA